MPEVIVAEPQINLTVYPDRFLTCRALQHTWISQGLPWTELATDGTNVIVVYERFLCPRCDTKKVDQRTPYGTFIRRNYSHEPGYRVSGQGAKKHAYAGERFKRILGSALEQQTA